GCAGYFLQAVGVRESYQRDFIKSAGSTVREAGNHITVTVDVHACTQAKLSSVLVSEENSVVPCKLAVTVNINADRLDGRSITPVNDARLNVYVTCCIMKGVQCTVPREVDQASCEGGGLRIQDSYLPPSAGIIE